MKWLFPTNEAAARVKWPYYLVERGWGMEIPIVLDAKGGNSFHFRHAGRKKQKWWGRGQLSEVSLLSGWLEIKSCPRMYLFGY